MTAKHLYLIDGSGYIFRAYYAIRQLSTSKGFPTNAIYGFTQMLISLMKEAKPEYWAIIFDSKEVNFRDEMYDQYKANRKEPPDDLVPQFEYFPKVVRALNIPMFIHPGFEADDTIATITTQAKARGFTVTIITGDKDLMQLVDDTTTMWDTMKNKHYKIPDVVEKFGVLPHQVVDILALMGDSSDNIPGVPGIGPKTAAQLIQTYGDLESLIKNTSQLKGKVKDNIEGNIEAARLSKKLATLATHVPIQFEESFFKHQSVDKDACRELFHELEFAKLISDLAPKAILSTKGYRLILKLAELEELVQKLLKEKPMLAIDTETTSLNTFQAKLVGVSLAWAKGEAVYIPVGHIGLDVPPQISIQDLLHTLQPVLNNKDIPKVGQNIKYDLEILQPFGFQISPIFGDTMVASYLLNPQGPHNLDDMSQQHLNHCTIKYEDVTGKGVKQKSFSEVPLDLARDYAAEDADCTWQLAEIFLKKLKEENLLLLFKNLEMPLMEVLLKMELTGIKIDRDVLEQLSQELGKEIKKLEEKIFAAAETSFNINSPKQLGEILFESLKIPGGKKTKTGFSTSQDVLEDLSEEYPIASLILEYRSLSKLKSTYTDALVPLIEPKTGRIHTSFNQTIAATGRLSSSNPNLQNIPIRSEEGRKIRTAFVAEKDSLLLSADYSQIELRILAHYTEDPNLIKAFQNDEDVHALTATALNIDRAAAKTVNFGIIYGQGAFGLSQQLKISPKDAAFYIENYFKQYPQVKIFREKALEEAKQKGFVTTLFGRRRFAPDLLSANFGIRQNAERMAFNTIFQGTAADIIKKAMVDIDRNLAQISPQTKMLLQVHDELVFEIPEKDLEKVQSFVKEKMENVIPLKVPLIVSCGVGPNWAEAH